MVPSPSGCPSRPLLGDAPLTRPDELHQMLNLRQRRQLLDRKSTRLNSSHANISYAVFCLKNNEIAATPSRRRRACTRRRRPMRRRLDGRARSVAALFFFKHPPAPETPSLSLPDTLRF